MEGELVRAARWLGASILLASGIIVVGLRWGQQPSMAPIPVQPDNSAQPGSIDPGVLRQSLETSPEPSRVQACGSIEDRNQTPILDPLPDGSGPASCLDPPSEVEVWKKLPKLAIDPRANFSTDRNNIKITIEKIGEKVDPCKVYPLAGPCQLVHCHYKCTVLFDQTAYCDDLLPTNHVKHCVEVVFIDKDHLRRCGPPAASPPDQP